MVTKKNIDQSTFLSEIAVFGAQEKKANDVVRLDLRKLKSAVSDYFIICNADSSTQVKAIADSVEHEVYKQTQKDPVRKEGFANADWVILDYFDVVIHIFKTEKRNFYGVEQLWSDAEVTTYPNA
ncbi:MAG: ribosome silencing factor [Sphingobacteriaceae bacterium]|nr:ribosome silencing factor [Sphingobacteriaceae bacterium]